MEKEMVFVIIGVVVFAIFALQTVQLLGLGNIIAGRLNAQGNSVASGSNAPATQVAVQIPKTNANLPPAQVGGC
ncbi:MAG: hypothetical protein AABX38_04225 [Candidatus Micrarchaeota archaeon]